MQGILQKALVAKMGLLVPVCRDTHFVSCLVA